MQLCTQREHNPRTASGIWYFSRSPASTIGIVISGTLFDLWIRGDEPTGATGAIHLAHATSELEIGFDHAFIVGIFL